MNIIVSTKKYNHYGFTTVQTVKNMEWEGINTVIFNNSIDNELEIVLSLTDAFEKVEKMIYIDDNLNPLYVSLFMGMGGDIYSDTEYLNQEDTLMYLIDEYKQTGMTVKTAEADIETLTNLLNTLSKDNSEVIEKLIKNGFWLKSIESSLTNVGSEIVRVGEANKTMIDVFNRTSDMFKHLKEESSNLKQEIDTLKLSLEQIELIHNKSGMKSTSFIFPTYQVPTTIPKILYIRVYSPCRFLLSFLMAYQHYLKMEKRLNSKLLIAVPKLKQHLKKYEDLPRLDIETVNNLNLGSLGDALVTFEPKSVVLNAFFNIRTDVYIVVDMMYGENLIAGYRVEGLNAVTSLSDINKFGLDSSKTIVSLRGTRANIVIPYIKDVNSQLSKSSMYTYYNSNCNDTAYKKLNKVILKDN